MTYNVRYFGHATRGLSATRRGIEGIARALAALAPLPELVCLQEVETGSLRSLRTTGHWGNGGRTQLDALVTRLDALLETRGEPHRYEAFYFPAHTYRLVEGANVYTTGLAMLVRSDLRVVEHNALRPHDITHRPREIRLKQTRVCAHAAFERGADRVDVFNTHLSLPAFWSSDFWTSPFRMGFGPNQLREAHQVARFVAATRQSEHVLLLGDFNALPGSPVDRFFREEAGFADAFRDVVEADDERARSFPTAGFMHLRMHLDHVYASPSLAWVDIEGTAGFGAEGPFDGLSDHVPIIARCRPRYDSPSTP
jgi:endonuclease/exonuclease/phosphatase family metal-dependent hydrolase